MILNIFDKKKYAKLALKNSKKYISATPFPHINLKNFLSKDVANKLYKKFPLFNDNSFWINYKNNNTTNKKSIQDERFFPSLFREMFRELNSRQFILFLETLTNINGLIPDPYFIGGGIHISEKGGYLKKHVDFNWHHKLQAHRRVNVLIYLTPNWKKEYNGDLELSNQNGFASYEPTFNSCIIFNTSANSFHGHPQPLNVNKNIFRRVLNMYYYTTNRNKNEIYNPTFTSYGKIKKRKINPKFFKIKASPWCNNLLKDYKKLK